MRSRLWVVVVAGLVAASACSGSETTEGSNGGRGGTAAARGGTSAGTSGAPAVGGSGGTARGGAAGSARGGTAGRATTGGTGSGATGGATGGSASATGGSAGQGALGGGGADAGAAGQGTGGTTEAPPSCENPAWRPEDFDTVYEVGPGLDYETPSDVPWESLGPGSLVRIHRRAEPYHDKWVVNATGTAERPVVVLGVPEAGELPVISGDGATTRSALDYWNEDRGIVKIGGSSSPSGPASYVTLACLDVESARPGTSFTAADGTTGDYNENAACIYLEDGAFISVIDNAIHGCGNGIFASSGSSDVRIAGNHVYDNGISGSAYEHNSYTEALGITFEYNRYGPLCSDCDGNNLKDRSAGTVIRYNWIESGNRQLDLVESDFDELVNDPRYHRTFVYGNVLIEPDGAGNNQILHYGGDGDDPSMYRKGTLYFYQNTVVSTRSGNTTLFRLSTEDESAEAFNNVFSVVASGSALAASAGAGKLALSHNFLPSGWVDSHDTLTGTVDDQGNVEGASAGFSDEGAQDFTLAADSPCLDRGEPLTSADVFDHLVASEYVKHQSGRARPDDGMPDLGAFERE